MTTFASSMSLEYWWLALLLLPAITVAPLVAIFLSVRAITNPFPLSTWVYVVLVLAVGLTLYLAIPLTIDRRVSAFWRAWWWFALAAIVLLPAVLYFEGRKREWFKRRRKRRRPVG